MENKISHFERDSHRLLHHRTARGPQHTGVALNVVQVNRHTVFSDSANILEHSPSGLSTPTKHLMRNGSLGTRSVITEP